MKERGILFSAPMVLSNRAGIKNQTRRTSGLGQINAAPDEWECLGCIDSRSQTESPCGGYWAFGHSGAEKNQVIRCPYGVAGDRLWVRETYRLETLLEDIPAGTLKNSKDPVQYCADGFVRGNPIDDFGRVRSARFMPRWACRDTLGVVSVRPERLQSITEEDAKAEGIVAAWPLHIAAFCDLWRSINGPDSWAKNPWVWRIEYKCLMGGVSGR